MLVAECITQGYGQRTVLQSLDLELRPGVTALLGPNGAGKTTLLQTLATVRPPRSGRLAIAGADISSEKAARSARRHIGYLPQRVGFDPGMRVRDFVVYGAWIRGVPSRDWGGESARALHYTGLENEARRKLGKLSGGMRQRAAIAWAIVGKPDLVLLDEPTVGLDPQQRFRFRELVLGLKGASVLLSTHLTDDVDAICDRVIVINRGTIIFQGATAQLKELDDPGMLGNTPIERAYMKLLTADEAVR
jgi:ABC-2 type transport system ATP-binding protein